MNDEPMIEKVVPFVPPVPEHLPPVAVDGVEPPMPLLELFEVEHYRWLIDGLLTGAQALADKPTVVAAIHVAHDLFHDLMVRVEEEVARR